MPTDVDECTLNRWNNIDGDDCIVATGGCSYQPTGSTGDGYRLAKEVGHTSNGGLSGA